MGTPAAKSKLDPFQSGEPGGSKRAPEGILKIFLQKLGPGLVTGASDDDPSGIGTYSQVGAQFGYALLWTMLLTYPLMAAIQEISARIGRVTGVGIAANLRKNYPGRFCTASSSWSRLRMCSISEPISGRWERPQLVLPGKSGLYRDIWHWFAGRCPVSSIFDLCEIPEMADLSLFAYVGVVFFAHVHWAAVVHATSCLTSS